MPRTIALAALFAILAPAAEVCAQTLFHRAPPEHRFVHRNALAARANPLGLIYEGRFSYRRRLYAHEAPLFRDNFVSLGVAPGASPVFGRVGAIVEVQPLSVLTLYALYEVVGYFGVIGNLSSFDSARSRYDDDTLDADNEYVTHGSQLTLGANVQLKVSDFVVRTQFKLMRASMRLRDGDRTFYDQFYDLLVADDGWFMTNDLDGIYQSPNGPIAGIRYTASRAFYGDEAFAPGENTELRRTLHRVGPLVGWTVRQRDGDRSNLLVFAAAQWWLVHPYRAGQETHRALPMLAAGVQVSGDLIPLD